MDLARLEGAGVAGGGGGRQTLELCSSKTGDRKPTQYCRGVFKYKALRIWHCSLKISIETVRACLYREVACPSVQMYNNNYSCTSHAFTAVNA